MSETKTDTEIAADKAGDILGDLMPVLAFVVVYNVMRFFHGEEGGWFAKDLALYWATAVLMVGTAYVVVMKKIQGKTIPPILIVSAIIIGGFGTIGILLQSKYFLFIKPTIQNLFLAAIIFGGLAFGKNVWKMMFKDVFALPDFAWKTLAIRWGLLFVAMAVWNEVLWRFYSEGTWANWKLGNMVLVFIFGLANTPYTLKHLQEDSLAPESTSEQP